MNEPAPCADTMPTIEEDPFSTSFMRDPYPHYERMREAGPLIYLRLYECFAVARHEEVQKVLSDWETFSSAAGVGLANFNSEKPWRPPSLVLEADPPLHTRTRMVLTRVLSPGNIRKLRDQFEREAEVLIDRLVALGRFDGIRDLAEPYPVKVFPDALGLAERGRENLLPYGSMVFNSFGPRNGLTEAAFANADAVRSWIMENCAREKLAPQGLGAQIYAAVDSGELSAEEAPMLVRSFLRGRRYHGGRLGQHVVVFGDFQGPMGKVAAKSLPGAQCLRGRTALRGPGPSFLPHHCSRHHHRRPSYRSEPEGRRLYGFGQS